MMYVLRPGGGYTVNINIDQPLIKVDEHWWTHNVYSVIAFIYIFKNNLENCNLI